MSYEPKFTRTHATFFEDYLRTLFHAALTQDNIDADVSAVLDIIDYKELAKRFGTEVFEHASYADLKWTDKVMKDERFIRASHAIEHAIAKTAPTQDAAKAIEFGAQMLAAISDPETQLYSIADAPDDVQARALEILFEKNKDQSE